MRYMRNNAARLNIAIALRADLATTSCAQTGPVRDEHELLVIGWTSAKPTILVDLGISA